MAFHQKGFAKQQMNKCGWLEGKGLGKRENGMTDAIKVKVKNNTGGLGHDHGAEFTFHWWDHIFNKAANSFKVAEDTDGVVIEKCEQNKVTPYLISNKRPLSNKFANKSLLYGTFVKSGTYHSENKELSDNLTDNDSSGESSDEENSSSKCTLQKTFEKTGLTGHKAARHGFRLSGKLQRIQEQEKKHVAVPSVEGDNIVEGEYTSCDNMKKKKKKRKLSQREVEYDAEQTSLQEDSLARCDKIKKKKKKEKIVENGIENDVEQISLQEDSHMDCDTTKKKKKKRKIAENEIENDGEQPFLKEDSHMYFDKIKKKKKKRKIVENEMESDVEQVSVHNVEDGHLSCEEIKKKKKKGKVSHEVTNDIEQTIIEKDWCQSKMLKFKSNGEDVMKKHKHRKASDIDVKKNQKHQKLKVGELVVEQKLKQEKPKGDEEDDEQKHKLKKKKKKTKKKVSEDS